MTQPHQAREQLQQSHLVDRTPLDEAIKTLEPQGWTLKNVDQQQFTLSRGAREGVEAVDVTATYYHDGYMLHFKFQSGLWTDALHVPLQNLAAELTSQKLQKRHEIAATQTGARNAMRSTVENK